MLAIRRIARPRAGTAREGGLLAVVAAAPAARRWRGRSGFTLVEIVVVLIMLGIAAAVAVPAFRPPAERSAGAAARALRELYADARNQAARRGVAVVVELTTAT